MRKITHINCPKALDSIPKGEEEYTIPCEATGKFCKVRLYRACEARFNFLKRNYGVDVFQATPPERVTSTTSKTGKPPVRGRR